MSETKRLLSDAQANLEKLPSYCFGKLLSDNIIIRITAGEMGYYQITHQEWPKKLAEKEGKTIDQIIDELNANEGKTIPQRKAMEFGSMWGWGRKLADPDCYFADGTINHEYLNTRP
jgi:hypothetical protein